METARLTMAQALLRFLDAQFVELDGTEHKFVQGVMGILGTATSRGWARLWNTEAPACATSRATTSRGWFTRPLPLPSRRTGSASMP